MFVGFVVVSVDVQPPAVVREVTSPASPLGMGADGDGGQWDLTLSPSDVETVPMLSHADHHDVAGEASPRRRPHSPYDCE